jgi:hypothetical protein
MVAAGGCLMAASFGVSRKVVAEVTASLPAVQEAVQETGQNHQHVRPLQ